MFKKFFLGLIVSVLIAQPVAWSVEEPQDSVRNLTIKNCHNFIAHDTPGIPPILLYLKRYLTWGQAALEGLTLLYSVKLREKHGLDLLDKPTRITGCPHYM